MTRWLLTPLCTAVLAGCLSAAGGPRVLEHVTVYDKPGRYGGWPANHGIWSWGNEIVVGFSAAYYQWLGPDRHPYNRTRPEEPYLARSLDGGESWMIEPAPALVPPEGMFTASGPGGKAAGLGEAIDFRQPGFCMTFRMADAQHGRSWFFYSYDRGRTWKGPFDFPMLGQTAIMARTDYIVNGTRDALVFLTAAKAAGGEGRPFVARTRARASPSCPRRCVFRARTCSQRCGTRTPCARDPTGLTPMSPATAEIAGRTSAGPSPVRATTAATRPA
jgi:hypothetical protein